MGAEEDYKKKLEEMKKEMKERDQLAANKRYEAELAAATDLKTEYYSDLKSKAKPKWDEVLKMARDFYQNKQMGYDSVLSVMSSQMVFCMTYSEACRAQAPIFIGHFIDMLKGEPSKTASPVSDRELKIDYSLDFVDGRVARRLERTDGIAVTKEQQQVFDAVVVSWLMGKDYEVVNGDPSRFQVKDDKPEKTPLDVHAFNSMKPEFEQYLQRLAEPQVTHTNRM